MKKFLTFVLVLAMVLSVSSVALAAYTADANADNGVASITSGGTTYYYSTLENAVSDAQAGDTITLLKDITVSTSVTILKSITIDGGNFTLTYTGNGASARAIEIPKEAGAAEVTIKNLTVDCTADYCQRGINYNATGKLNLDNVTVKGTNLSYALNLPGMADGCIVNVDNSSLTGLLALNVYGADSEIYVTNTALTSVDPSSEENYGAVTLGNDGSGNSAENTKIVITGGSVTAKDENGQPSKATRNQTNTGTITVSDTTTVIGKNVICVAIVKYGGDNYYSFETLEAAVQHAEEPGNNTTINLLTDDVDISSIQTNEDLTIFGADGTRYSTSNGTVGIDYSGVRVSPIKLDFGTKEAGYSGVTAQTLTVKAHDVPSVTSNDDYVITLKSSDASAQVYTFDVRPKDGLNAGNHDADITVVVGPSTSPNFKSAVKAKFTVTAPASGGSGISVKYNGGNSFSTSNPSVPTGVEIDGVPVTFNGTGSNFTVGCISSDAKWVTVRWNSTSVTTNFTPDGLVECTTVSIPKTGDMSFWAAVAAFFGF